MSKEKLNKLNPEEEAKSFIDGRKPDKQTNLEERLVLLDGLVDTIIDFRDKLPPRSNLYFTILTSIVVSLNTYKRYEKEHIGLWYGYEHLCMAYTHYSHLIYCTAPKSCTRDSKVRGSLHNFLKENLDSFHNLLSQYLNYNTKH